MWDVYVSCIAQFIPTQKLCTHNAHDVLANKVNTIKRIVLESLRYE